MNVGDIHKTHEPETMAEIRARIIKSADGAFGHIASYDQIDRLCLMVSMLQRHTAERNEALAMNAAQAQRVSILERKA